MTYTARANEHFPIPTLCAIYVRPEVRGKGACKALMHEFIQLSRAAKMSAAEVKGRPQGVCSEDGQGVCSENGQHRTGTAAEEAASSARASVSAEARDVSDDDCEMYGIEAPVSKALLSALPRIFSTAMLKRFRVIQHGDSLQQVSSRGTLWQVLSSSLFARVRARACLCVCLCIQRLSL
jgi:hypothetical protein